MIKTYHVIISGKVQGVWYRAWTAETALKLGINGWVRNRKDGTVEAVFSGDEAALNQILAACKEGPQAAIVSNITSEEVNETPEVGFRKLPTI